MNYLVSLANVAMRILAYSPDTPFAEWPESAQKAFGEEGVEAWKQFYWVFDITNAITMILWPLLIVVAAAGSIYAVILGVNMARADSTEKREEGKKRLMNVLIGMGVIIALILLMQLFVNAILPAFL